MDKKLSDAIAQMSLNSAGTNNPGSSASNAVGAPGRAGTYDANMELGAAGGTNDVFSQVFPVLQGYMNQDSALVCRAVCKDWKKGVDEALSGETPPSTSAKKS